MTTNCDTRQRFIFENANVRGEIVRLGPSWRQLHASHPYPAAVLKIMGELLSSTILLSATLKFEGRLTAQLQTDGPINLVVTECTSASTFRGIAQYNDQVTDLNHETLLQKGILALTIEPEKGERYQGIIDIPQGNIADAIDDYMLRSQQIDTRIWLAGNEQTIAGLLLQQLPGTETDLSDDPDLWNKLLQFSDTIKEQELLEKDFVTLLKLLYPEDDIRVFDPVPVQFRCHCSHEKVKSLLRTLGEADISELLTTQNKVGVNCEFCNKHYEFDQVDIKEIFSANIESEHSNTRH